MTLLSDLTSPLAAEAAQLLAELQGGAARRLLTGLKGSSLPLLLARLDRELADGLPWLLLTAQATEAEAIASDLRSFGADGVAFYPELEILPYDRHSADHGIISTRIEVLDDLRAGRVRFLVTSARGWMRRVLPPEMLAKNRLILKRGFQIEPEELADRLVEIGYRATGQVAEPGDFALRGGILDLFAPTGEEPMRIEFFGDEVESLRNFDATTQLSTGGAEQCLVLPCAQTLLGDEERRRAVTRLHAEYPAESLLTENLALSFSEGIGFEGIDRYSGFFHEEVPLDNYLSGEYRTVIVDEGAFADRWRQMDEEVQRRYQRALEDDDLPPPPSRSYLGTGELARLLALPRLLLIEDELSEAVASPRAPALKIRTASQPSFGHSIKELRRNLDELNADGFTTWIFCDNAGQAERLRSILADDMRLQLPVGDVQHGFLLPDEKIAVYTDHEIFERYKRLRRRRRAFRGAAPVRDRDSLRSGDYVVHIHHGIARYRGMKQMDVLGEMRELLHLSYNGEQELYLPVEQIHLIEKYSNKDDAAPRLSRLGEKGWQRTRRRAEKAVREKAAELLDLYARREANPGFAFQADTPWQDELEASFLYQDTPDQARCSSEVKADMELSRPMDRLVCGDVGFGKTEVAVRAAFKAVQAGKQVAVLVPTTILAQQHAHSFAERLRDYPVRVDLLSRFRSAAQVRQTTDDLAAGKVDIVIGTHRLLGKTIRFRDLGLLVIDEEHRFGVTHKEKIKRARASVDVLTLTATPIPRTLHMALGGLRDVSLIQTPPRDRLPVHTEIIAFGDDEIREAILRELDRGGQVFFVHNRVETIDAMAAFLRDLIPDINLAVGHGQMPEKQLEQVMVDFIAGEHDLLLSTMIIEAGLDIPRVNTILVNRADRFGLAQLHQLRGRVGRSRQRAYAYFMVPRDRGITDDARRRLEALAEHDELGAGYKLALRDMELRGAGNMLGEAQHGHVAAIGFDLYLRLLGQAVRELRDGAGYRADVEIESRLNAWIPDDYVTDPEQKMAIYRRLGHTDSGEAAERLQTEIRDRFGPMPPPVSNLFALLEIKVLAMGAGIARVKLGRKTDITFQEGAALKPEKIAELSETFGGQLQFKGSDPLGLSLSNPEGEELPRARKLLKLLAGCVSSIPSTTGK